MLSLLWCIAGLSLIPSNIGLTDIDHSLAGLGNNFARVADTDMDLMFRKVGCERSSGWHIQLRMS